jgi:hypothetical protein
VSLKPSVFDTAPHGPRKPADRLAPTSMAPQCAFAFAGSPHNRAAELRDVPTTAEAGFTDADYTLWIGLFTPAKTPRSIVDRLHDETAKAMHAPSVREQLAWSSANGMVARSVGVHEIRGAYVQRGTPQPLATKRISWSSTTKRILRPSATFMMFRSVGGSAEHGFAVDCNLTAAL